jgi:hypothetical protein
MVVFSLKMVSRMIFEALSTIFSLRHVFCSSCFAIQLLEKISVSFEQTNSPQMTEIEIDCFRGSLFPVTRKALSMLVRGAAPTFLMVFGSAVARVAVVPIMSELIESHAIFNVFLCYTLHSATHPLPWPAGAEKVSRSNENHSVVCRGISPALDLPLVPERQHFAVRTRHCCFWAILHGSFTPS